MKAWVCSTYRLVKTFSQLYFKQFYLRIAFFTFCIYVRVIINQSYKVTKLFFLVIFLIHEWFCNTWGRPGLVCVEVGFTNTYVISAYHHWSCEFKSRSGEVYSIQQFVIRFIRDLWQVGHVILRTFQFPSPIKLTATI